MNNKINVTRSSMPGIEEYMEEIKTIFESRWLTNAGAKHKALEAQLRSYLGVNNISLFCNGHMALELTLKAMELKGEVITTPFTFASTTHAIVRNGLTPVFCDINEDNYTIDVSKIEELITEKTCAILPVHVYGSICNAEEIARIADKYNLKVIYDAAHAFGETYNGKGVGSIGDAAMFSFHATKVFHTIEGGAVCCNEEDLCGKLSVLRNFGINGGEDAEYIGANAKMNEFEAAMGICNLRHINEEIEKRKAAAEHYRSVLNDVSGIKLCAVQEGVKSNYAYFPVVFDKEKFGKSRDEVIDILAENNIYARKYFYPLTSEFTCYKDRNYVGVTPTAHRISENILTLPLYADIKKEEVDKICKLILG